MDQLKASVASAQHPLIDQRSRLHSSSNNKLRIGIRFRNTVVEITLYEDLRSLNTIVFEVLVEAQLTMEQ